MPANSQRQSTEGKDNRSQKASRSFGAIKTDPDVKELVDGQVESFVIGVGLSDVVEVSGGASVNVDHFNDGPPATRHGRPRQLPVDPDGQLGALLARPRHVEPRHTRHVDE